MYAQQQPASSPMNEDSLNNARQLDMFRINFQSGYYAAAYSEWKKVYAKNPSFSQAIYIEGAPLFDSLISKENNKVRKQILIDSLMKLYDDRIRYYGKDGYILGRKALQMLNYYPDRVVEANAMLKRSIELEAASTRPAVFVYYMSTCVELMYKGTFDSTVVYAAYDLIFKNVFEALRVNQPEGNLYSSAFRNVEDYLRPISRCSDFNTRFLKSYQADSNNISSLKSMFKALMDRKCYTSDFCKLLAKRIYDFDTTGEAPLHYGNYLFTIGDINKSVRYLFWASKSTNPDLAVRGYLALGNSYKFMDVPPRAQNMVEKALEIQPKNGNIYIFLGDLYRYSFEECGPNEMDKRSVYWLAADTYRKAMELDPSVKAIAEKRLTDCNINFPMSQTLKRLGMVEGDSYKVPSWIASETTVRARK
jgi:tetratricopeptide (TPR) repeat protein